MITPPWQLVYADGSANVYRIASDGTYAYEPVTRERSSTGMYDGGPPRAGTGADVAEIARHVEALAAAARPDEPRAKGTGAFALTTPDGARRFVVARGPALAAFDALLAELP